MLLWYYELMSQPHQNSASLQGPRSPEHGAVFDGGSFEIRYLSTSPAGFRIVTDSVVGRTPEEGLSLTPDQRNLLKNAMGREMEFNGVGALRASRRAWREKVAAQGSAGPEGSPDSIKELEDEYFARRTEYQARGKK